MQTSYVQLPRNFAFFDRLPRIFSLKIVGPGKPHNDGFWYPAGINGHKLHVFSTELLMEGKAYKVEKKSTLKLKIISKADSQELPANKTEPNQATEQELSKDHILPHVMSFTELLGLSYYIADGKFIQKRNPEVYSFPIQDKFSGAFIFHQRKSGFSLLLPMEIFNQTDIRPIKKQLEDCLIKDVELTPSSVIEKVAAGIKLDG